MNSKRLTAHIDRRGFLNALIGAGGAMALGGCRMFSFGGKGNRTVFVSDVHVGTEVTYQLERFRAVVDSILAMNPLPKRVVCFGDIAYLRGPVADYRVSRPEFERLLAAGIELTFGMGNHDRRANFLEVWPEYRKRMLMEDRIVSEVDLGDCDLIMLDTLHEPDETATEKQRNAGWITPGQLVGAQFEWLKSEMAKRKRPFFLGAHHAPYDNPAGDAEAVIALVMNTPLCVGWIHGHDHVWRKGLLRRPKCGWGDNFFKRVLCLPSTGHWGDIGYTRFETESGAARAELEMMDHFFPTPDKRVSALDDDLVAEKRGEFMTFRW